MGADGRSTRIAPVSGCVLMEQDRLEGFEVRTLELRPDDRGFFCELYRSDWSKFFREPVVQFNLSSSYPGIVRAWHRHARGQVDYFIVVQGALRICAYDPEVRALEEVVSSDRRLQVVRVPGRFYHGTMAVGDAPALTLYATTVLYDYASPDEERLLWNDPSVMPLRINGDKADPRNGLPWDWLRPPHR
jgi:dTDP-4-dehydrorhamnose 3,5-epimerase